LTTLLGPVEKVEKVELGFSALDIPVFVAGFVYGMTGDNDLVAIQGCWTGGEEVLVDGKKFFEELTAENYTAAADEAKTTWTDIMSQLETCKGIKGDISAIEEWA